MQNSILIISFLFLVGCASTKEPAINTVIQKVEVPIAVPCKAIIPVKPDFNFDKLTLEQDVFEKTRALLADRKLHLGYEGELLTSLVACTK
jgi:uncharacterized protein YcfL